MSVAIVHRLSGGVVSPPQSSTDCCVLTHTFQAVSETRMAANTNWRARLCIATASGGGADDDTSASQAWMHPPPSYRTPAAIWDISDRGVMNAQADRLRRRQPAQGFQQPQTRRRARQARPDRFQLPRAAHR